MSKRGFKSSRRPTDDPIVYQPGVGLPKTKKEVPFLDTHCSVRIWFFPTGVAFAGITASKPHLSVLLTYKEAVRRFTEDAADLGLSLALPQADAETGGKR